MVAGDNDDVRLIGCVLGYILRQMYTPQTNTQESPSEESRTNEDANKMMSAPQSNKKRKCSFKKEWTTLHSWVRPTDKPDKAFCYLCNSSFSAAHGGKNDVKRHAGRDSHQKKFRQQETSKPMQSFLLSPKHDSLSDKVTAAEGNSSCITQ